jgi:hypothetical protein
MIGGMPASKSKVVLRKEQSFKFLNVHYTYPAGDYRPAYEGATGVYYEAPGAVVMQENFLGMGMPKHPYTGGIFVERADPKRANLYLVAPNNEGGEIQRALKGGRPYILNREPVTIDFELKPL